MTQPATQPAGQQGQPPAQGSGQPDSESGRIQSLDDRFGAIESEQQRQGGVLERIEQILSGGKAPAGGSSAPAAAAGGPSIAEQVRRGVEEIEQRRQREQQAQQAQQADQQWRQSVESRLFERRPAEPATGRRNKLQRFLFGQADER